MQTHRYATVTAKPDCIQTARLVLRRPVYSDARYLHVLLSDPELCRFSPATVSDSLATTHFTIVEWHEARMRGIGTYVGALKSDPDLAIGFIQVGSDGDIGGLVAPAHSRVGLASEAIDGVLNELGIPDPWTNLLMHKDGTVSLSGTSLFLDFFNIEINGDERVVMNSQRVDLN